MFGLVPESCRQWDRLHHPGGGGVLKGLCALLCKGSPIYFWYEFVKLLSAVLCCACACWERGACCGLAPGAVACLGGEQVAGMVFSVNVLFPRKILAVRSGQQMWSVDRYRWWEGELQYTLLMEKNRRSNSLIYAFGDVKWSCLKRFAQQALSKALLPPYFMQIFLKRLFLSTVAGWAEVGRGAWTP